MEKKKRSKTKALVPLSPEQIDLIAKGHKITNIYVFEDTLIICLDDGGQIQHKVELQKYKNKHGIMHTLHHVVNKEKSDDFKMKKYDGMYW